MTPLTTTPLPKTHEELTARMLTCEQTPGQTVYQHGVSVAQHLMDLMDAILDPKEPLSDSWRLPKWFSIYREQLRQHCPDEITAQLYAINHDCGKPYCLEIDEDGRRHFPDHAKVSAQIWESLGGDPRVGKLIADDMVIHTASAEEIAQRLESDWSCDHALTLLLTSLAEIHSNAKMFGGIESVSFKSKYKKVEQRGTQILKKLFPAVNG